MIEKSFGNFGVIEMSFSFFSFVFYFFFFNFFLQSEAKWCLTKRSTFAEAQQLELWSLDQRRSEFFRIKRNVKENQNQKK